MTLKLNEFFCHVTNVKTLFLCIYVVMGIFVIIQLKNLNKLNFLHLIIQLEFNYKIKLNRVLF